MGILGAVTSWSCVPEIAGRPELWTSLRVALRPYHDGNNEVLPQLVFRDRLCMEANIWGNRFP